MREILTLFPFMKRLRDALKYATSKKAPTSPYEKPTDTFRKPLDELHPAQQEIMSTKQRMNCLVAGRRFGKTSLMKALLLDEEPYKQSRAYITPTHHDYLEVWDAVVECLPPSAKPNASLHRIKMGGYHIDFHSAEKPDRLRGNKYGLVIIDESASAQRLRELVEAAIRPTLVDYKGSLWLVGTPKGMDYFFEWYSQPNVKSWTFTSYDNPYLDPSELDELKASLPDRVFRQEVLGEFISDGRLFSNVVELSIGKEELAPVPGEHYVVGVDIAFQKDFTAIVIMSVERKQVVRLIKGQWELQALGKLLEDINTLYKPHVIALDATGMGLPVVQHIRPLELPIKPITITKEIKELLIHKLMIAMEQKNITLMDNRGMKQELTLYEERNGKYNAPSGYHDDIVIALALANNALQGAQASLVF